MPKVKLVRWDYNKDSGRRKGGQLAVELDNRLEIELARISGDHVRKTNLPELTSWLQETNAELFFIYTDTEEEQTCVGFCVLAYRRDLRHGTLTRFYILKKHRRKHLGRETMKKILAKFKKEGIRTIGLTVYTQNTPARRFYESFGFGVRSLNMEKEI